MAISRLLVLSIACCLLSRPQAAAHCSPQRHLKGSNVINPYDDGLNFEVAQPHPDRFERTAERPVLRGAAGG